MKKFIFCLMAIVLSLTFLPVQSFAATKEGPSSLVVTKPPEPAESAEAKALVTRLDEIKAMDMSKLKSAEKKDLRKETRSIRRELKTISGGVYVSAGVLIVVLIILVIILS
jgi:hypothetical protein